MQILGKAIRNVHSWDFAAVDVLANDRFPRRVQPIAATHSANFSAGV
jgi:hypothetical protein